MKSPGERILISFEWSFPASRTRTVIDGFSDSRVAMVRPAVPPPMMLL